ncbi:5'-3'-deoxyribonucleotidase [Paenibacillus psychroresistens]|uniref:5'-3'-deoxyribonucleotidase n=2 Tax=Paenibacillus psychroresistens TaxID=1778678 RepID=A0A6B8RUU6_9BACL|nr:5'-3'-deoxyribonucleotidase [Paenibacillus psychroresistens]
MDGVIADHLNKHLTLYNRDYEDQLTFADLQGKKLREMAKCGIAVQKYYQDPTFFRDLVVMEGSQSVVKQLQENYEIFIATAAMEFPLSFQAKYEWLTEHFDSIPKSNIVFCGDKGILHADYLIDDNSYNFKNFKGKGILFTSPHNVYETEYARVNNWQEVAAMFLG